MLPHCEEIVSALWLRSLTLDKIVGADPAELQIDITRSKPIDDNQFQAELATIEENSFNIHRIGNRLVFKHDENLQARSSWPTPRTTSSSRTARTSSHLAKEIRSVISGPEHVSQNYRVVVLEEEVGLPIPGPSSTKRNIRKTGTIGCRWWSIPEYPEKLDAALGNWLKTHSRRPQYHPFSACRRRAPTSIFYDRELLVLARAVYLAMQWKKDDIGLMLICRRSSRTN